MKKKKYYYVWKGLETGYFGKNWIQYDQSVTGYAGSQHMGFATKSNAMIASKLTYEEALLRRKRGEL